MQYVRANLVLQNFGIFGGRLYSLPTITSPNLIGVLAVLALLALWHLPRCNRLAIIVLFGGLYLMLTAETRSAIAAVVAGLVHMTLRTRLLAIVAKASVILALISPLLMYLLVTYLKDSGFDALDRQGYLGAALGFGTGRDIVWRSAMDVLSNDIPSLLWGYGMAGHIASGIAETYQRIFIDDIHAHTLHNATLQNLVDGGVVSAALFGSLLWLSVDRILKQEWLDVRLRRMALVSMCTILWLGCWETAGTIYHRDAFFYLVFILALAIPQPEVSASVVAAPPPEYVSTAARKFAWCK